MTKNQEIMDNKATKIFKEFIELYCFYLRKQNEDSEPTELKFTLSLETFTPQNKLCHQKYIGDIGPLLRALGNLQRDLANTGENDGVLPRTVSRGRHKI